MNEKNTLTRGRILLIIFVVLMILIFVFSIKIIKGSYIKKYKEFENELTFAAENYYVIKNIKIKEGEEKKFTIKQLSSMNLVYNDLKNKCDGYVIVSNERDIMTKKYNIVYNAYIKCGKKYVTVNYSEY